MHTAAKFVQYFTVFLTARIWCTFFFRNKPLPFFFFTDVWKQLSKQVCLKWIRRAWVDRPHTNTNTRREKHGPSFVVSFYRSHSLQRLLNTCKWSIMYVHGVTVRFWIFSIFPFESGCEEWGRHSPNRKHLIVHLWNGHILIRLTVNLPLRFFFFARAQFLSGWLTSFPPHKIPRVWSLRKSLQIKTCFPHCTTAPCIMINTEWHHLFPDSQVFRQDYAFDCKKFWDWTQ